MSFREIGRSEDFRSLAFIMIRETDRLHLGIAMMSLAIICEDNGTLVMNFTVVVLFLLV